MHRKSDSIDSLLEAWAGWCLTEDIYTGTGHSSFTRIFTPFGGQPAGSRVLWSGRINSQMSSLNKSMVGILGERDRLVAIELYGRPGTIKMKSEKLQLSCSTLARVKRKAREVAGLFVPYQCFSLQTINTDIP